MSNPSPTKRPREEKEANQPPTFLGYSAERYFNKMMATGELIAERDALKAKLAAAEATIAQQAAIIAEIAQIARAATITETLADFEGASARVASVEKK